MADQVWVELLAALKKREGMAAQIAIVVGGQQPYACFSTAGELVAILNAANVAAPSTPAPDPVPSIFTVYINTPNDVLNVRAAPNTKAAILRKLSDQTAVEVEAAVSGWHKLKGETAYISAQYVSDKPRPVPVPQPEPSDPVVIVPKQVSGIGAHVMVGHYDTRLASYPVIKSLNDPAVLNDAHTRNPKAVCIFRRYYSDADQAVYLKDGPQAAVERWINENQYTVMAAPFAYHEGLNEPGEVSPELVEFERLRVIELAKLGVKACVLNLGVGHTADQLWQREDMKRLLSTVRQYEGAIGLHCYAEGVISAYTGAAYWKADGTWSMPGQPFPAAIETASCWLALRVIEDRRIIHSLGFDPLIIATELGLDDCVTADNGLNKPHGLLVRGWRSCIGTWMAEGWLNDISAVEFYRKQLNWWVEQTGLLGCVYAHGDETEWGEAPNKIIGCFDTRGLL